MALFQSTNVKEKKHSGIMGNFAVDVIKWEPESNEEASIIAHKYEYEDFPNGSYLIVNPSQMAIFCNNLNAGNSMSPDESGNSQVSVFIGPCKIKLETGDSRFAPFRNVTHTLTGGDSAFHSTVYYVNTTYMNELPWGTHSPLVVQDPEEEINVHVRAHGFYGVHIEQIDTTVAASQARKFLQKIVGTRSDYTREELEDFMRAKILEFVPDLLAKSIIEQNIGVLKISSKLSLFSETIHAKLFDHFDEFGLTLDNFSFHSINVPDEDLRELNEMKIKRKRAQLEAEGNARKMDIESAAMARKREREGYTYQQEHAFDVLGTAAANEGTSSTFMGAGMGLGMGVGIGGAVGSGMSTMANQTIGNINMNPSNVNQTAGETNENVCPVCGKRNSAQAKFCFECGSKLDKEEKCPECGGVLIKGAKFCPNCGKKLSSKCPGCGADLTPGSKFCPECGTRI
ncbi:MAG: SPFH domain-containing protein [Clostridiales bacterium]|nr:SPFH domain-containing protein [Clostridiales bacterium]